MLDLLFALFWRVAALSAIGIGIIIWAIKTED